MDFQDNRALLSGVWHRVLANNAVALVGILLLVLAIAIGRKLTQDRVPGAATGFDTIWALRIAPTISPANGLISGVPLTAPQSAL